MDDNDKFISIEKKKYQDSVDENTLTDFKTISKPIAINDIIEVCNEEDKLNSCKKIFIINYTNWLKINSFFISIGQSTSN